MSSEITKVSMEPLGLVNVGLVNVGLVNVALVNVGLVTMMEKPSAFH